MCVSYITSEAALVPGLAGAPHQLRDEDGLVAARADVRSSPLGLERLARPLKFARVKFYPLNITFTFMIINDSLTL